MHALFPLFTVVLWAGNTLVTKLSAGLIAPASITFYRWALAFLLLLPFTAAGLWRERERVRRHLPQLAALGLLGMVIYQGLAYSAAHSTSATNMGILIALSPLMSALLSSVLAREPLTWGALLGGLVSFAGVLCLIARGEPGNVAHLQLNAGDGLMLIAVLANALYGVLLRRWQLPLSTWLQLTVQVGCALVCLLPWYLLGERSGITAQSLPLVLYAGLLASILAPWLWINGVQAVGPSRASLFLNLIPLIVALVAVGWLGERLAPYHAVGGALALLGVWLGQALRRPLRAAPQV
ncbi:DMT family transporter [Pseudomonas sp. KNUC1026]|uniref:DMT family transporter n=1 Tax=Pseudomonas sp. KNUC1026 TaxID=2893890 RepID=UPI001F227923|nr:DMT family transporter [Pseudomonas sp. KNUC1026]UFH51692.1 DMT family transporter [Pseudomonas sp. KNUC1026]